MEEARGITSDAVNTPIPVGEIDFTEVPLRSLPLYVVITNQVFNVDLPQKEFLGEMEYEAYLERLAQERYDKDRDREKFVKKHLNNALYLDDEIIGESVFHYNQAVDFESARLCGFGILKTQSKQFYMFQTSLGIDLPYQLAAYQALTFGFVGQKYQPLLASKEARERLKQVVGADVYRLAMERLGLTGFLSE